MMRTSGFTLLELLVALALALLLLGLVPPLLSAALPGVTLQSAARELAAGLRMARNLAITRQRSTALQFDLESRRYRIEGRSRHRSIPRGVEIELLTARSELATERRAGIRFFSDGGSTGGRVTLHRGRRALAIDVDWLTGGIRILEPEPDRK